MDNSIHPRNWKDGNREKRNTCANGSLHKRLARQLAGIEGHLETHPRDTMSHAYPVASHAYLLLYLCNLSGLLPQSPMR